MVTGLDDKEAWGTEDSDMATGLLVLKAVVAFFLLPCAAASLGISMVSNAGQVKLQK